MVMLELETKFIIEFRTGYTMDKDGQFLGGEWQTFKDEFGFDLMYDRYFEAYRSLQNKCPAIGMFGKNVCRVKEVEMLPKRKT
jgi:hypothetical protein